MEQIAPVSEADDAFICYSRQDRRFAVALQQALVRYKPPRDLPVPQRRLAVFRDETDITGVDYYDAITQHLTRSRKLIIVCSPNARRSDFVNDEIRRFVSTGSADDIIPVLFEGSPNNEVQLGQEDEKAFPDALVDALDFPLAGSFVGIDLQRERVDRGRFQNSWHKLLADIYGVSRGELEQREKKRQARRTRLVVTVSGAVSLVLAIALAVALVSRRQAIDRGEIALSRLLAAESDLHTSDRLGLASLLAVEAVSVAPTHQAHDRLLRIVQTFRNTEHVMSGNLGAIRHMKYSADGAYLAAADSAGHVMVWDRLGRPLGPPADSDGVVADALAVRSDGLVAIARPGQGVELWQAAQNTRSTPPARGDGRVIDLAFAAGGRWLVIVYLPQEIVWWDLQRRQLIAGASRDGHRALVDGLAASGDGRYVVSHDVSGNVLLWNCSGDAPELAAKFAIHYRIAAAAFTRDGTTLAFARQDQQRSIVLWRIDDESFMGDPVWNLGGHQAAIRALGITSTGERLVSVDATGKAIDWHRESTGFRLASSRQLPDHQSVEYAVSPDAEKIALGRRSGEVVILNMADRHTLFTEVAGYDDRALSPRSVDGVRVAAFTANDTVVVRDIAAGAVIGSVETTLGSELPFSWSGAGRLAAVDRSGSIRIWDSIIRSWAAPLPGPERPSQSYRIALSYNGARVGLVGERGSVDLWDIDSRRRIKLASDYRNDARVLSLSPAGDRLVTADETGIVSFWDLDNERFLGTIDLTPERVIFLAFSPDGAFLAVGGRDGRVGIVDAFHRSPYLNPDRVHNGAVSAIAFSRNGSRMASGDTNGDVRLWNVKDRTLLGSALTGEGRAITGLGFSEDDKVLASASPSSLRLWDVDPSSWQRHGCAIANRDLTCIEWREHLGDRPFRPHCGISREDCKQ